MKSVCLLLVIFLAFNFSFGSRSNRVVERWETEPNEFPFMVLIWPVYAEGGTTLCGGSIISEFFVLSARWGLDAALSAELVFGAHNYGEEEPGQFRMTVSADNFHKHPLYDRNHDIFDVILIRTNEQIIYNNLVQPINLPTLDAIGNFAERLGITLGWGLGSETRLHGVTNLIMAHQDCQIHRQFLVSSSVCLASRNRIGPCVNDQGAPLVIYESEIGRFVLIGVLSGPSCDTGIPSIFTRTTAVRQWINGVTKI